MDQADSLALWPYASGPGDFLAGGGPVDSILALFSFLSTGLTKRRYLDIKILLATLQPSSLGQAQAFANALADRFGNVSQSAAPAPGQESPG